MWDFEKDSDKTCFDHRGDYIPESIANEAKKELRRRGYSEEKIHEEEETDKITILFGIAYLAVFRQNYE